MPVTLEDLLDAVRKLADSNFATAAAINKLVPAFEQLRRDIYDIKSDREMDQAKLDLAVGKLNTDLALLLDNVRHAQTDVRELQRDITGTHHTLPPDTRTSTERVIDRFEKLPTPTKLLLLVFVIMLAASGWLAHIIGG